LSTASTRPRSGRTGARTPIIRPFAASARSSPSISPGRRTAFDLPLAPSGTDFQRRVWREIAKVPPGRTTTYAAIAARAGAAGSARAAGAATGRNPLSIVVPCHRIVASSGALTGYAGGLDRASGASSPSRARP
jgi:methylated-DNA-[protein]-cysteine S-methyltransferase